MCDILFLKGAVLFYEWQANGRLAEMSSNGLKGVFLQMKFNNDTNVTNKLLKGIAFEKIWMVNQVFGICGGES